MPASLQLSALPGIPLVAPGDDLPALIDASLRQSGLSLRAGDVVVVAQKVVSKAENRFVDLAAVEPSPRALALAQEIAKDPRLVEVILRESSRIVRARPGLLIVEHRLGFVMANAGVDQSNVGPQQRGQRVLLLPADPDASAARLRERLMMQHACDVAVIVSDSFGRAWRRGTIGTALGVAGMPALVDLRGQPDLFGRAMKVSTVALADQVASAAALLMGEAAEAAPVVLVRGLEWSQPPAPAQALVRTAEEDLFR
jgi:coenzyme F420-0:L-glutamate ligase / coenzyme F420-1:gamma-L-glutamate ligase